MANAWLEAMGVPQWQLREIEVAKEASTVLAAPEVVTATAEAIEQPEVAVPQPRVEEPAIAAAEPVNYKQIPLLIVWSESQEQAVAGAGSLPSGELGDLLANIVIAVGLTEDVVEAWSSSPADLAVALQAKRLKPKCVWHFEVGQTAQQDALLLAELQTSIALVKAPALRELQAQKPLKAELWKLLKALKASGLWR